MDNWIASDIEDKIEYGRTNRSQYNTSRKIIRNQTYDINDYTILSTSDDTINKKYACMDEDTLMDTGTETTIDESTHKSFVSTKPDYSSINNKSADEPFSEHNDSDDDICILDAYEPFINLDTSSGSDDEQQQQQQKQQYDEIDDEQLHSFTTINTSQACKQLLHLFRDTKTCKSQTQKFLTFIKSILPTPNQLSSTMTELLSKMNIHTFYEKRMIRALSRIQLDPTNKKYSSCIDFEEKHRIHINQTTLIEILGSIKSRLMKDIQDYQEKIHRNDASDRNKTYDIPLAFTYQNLLRDYNKKNFISLLFYLDGNSLCKSTKLKLWILSAAIIELSTKLRYQRQNMPLISVWMG